jgi:5-oxopent-3-ene-1,2,5-tricarboxylate decarboxylase/2-hydroxyhepta-2,4-diene-1,7-dioate isomerase
MSHPPLPRGTVYGVALNDPADLAALGDAVQPPPYKAAPKAPVLYIKPHNTWSASGAAIVVPVGTAALRMGAALGVVIARTGCRVNEADALAHVAGYRAVNDVAVPHPSWYRPSVPCLARDGFCVLGEMVKADAIVDPDALPFTVTLDGEVVQQASTAGRMRGVARLIADLSEFMTLHPGDIVMTGLTHNPPQARAGQRVGIRFDGMPLIENTLVAEVAA